MQPSANDRPPWWIWPTVLSLDAPLVALVWQGLLAVTASTSVGTPEAVVLGCSVWLAYAADRWIEGWRLVPASIQTHRHRFYQTLRWPLAVLWAAVLGLDLVTAARGLTTREFRAGLLVLAPVVAYLLSHQLVHRKHRWRAPKELCVAGLIACGSTVFVASQPGVGARDLALPVALFAMLCLSNCVLISVWEDEVDKSHGQTSLALQFSIAAPLGRALPWALLGVCLAVGVAGGTGIRSVAACGAASGALLGLVDLAEPRIGRGRARVLADIALMTPVVPLLLRHLA